MPRSEYIGGICYRGKKKFLCLIKRPPLPRLYTTVFLTLMCSKSKLNITEKVVDRIWRSETSWRWDCIREINYITLYTYYVHDNVLLCRQDMDPKISTWLLVTVANICRYHSTLWCVSCIRFYKFRHWYAILFETSKQWLNFFLQMGLHVRPEIKLKYKFEIS